MIVETWRLVNTSINKLKVFGNNSIVCATDSSKTYIIDLNNIGTTSKILQCNSDNISEIGNKDDEFGTNELIYYSKKSKENTCINSVYVTNDNNIITSSNDSKIRYFIKIKQILEYKRLFKIIYNFRRFKIFKKRN
jgi:hypothetical protein